MSTRGKVWRVASQFHGKLSKEHFKLEEQDLPAIKDGELMTEVIYLTVDPYMKIMGETHNVGDIMAENALVVPLQIARVIESKNPKFPVGTLVWNSAGWKTHVISDGTTVFPLPELNGLSPSHILGALGSTGLSAYFSFLDVCQPRPDDVVVVNAAAGAVGHLIVQIAKVVGCKKIIAYAGSDEKCKWLRELGADHAYNYKKTNLEETIKEAAPDGIDCFVDNVGGTAFETILRHMRFGGRVSLCGEISQYNRLPSERDKIDFLGLHVILSNINIRGFSAYLYLNRQAEVRDILIRWHKEKKVKFGEKIVNGFERLPDALLSIFNNSHENTGKVIVKV